MPDEDDPEGRRQRVLARRSTYAGLGGTALVALGLLLTEAHVFGNGIPTALAVLGLGSLIAGVSTGTMQVIDRYRRPDSDFDA